MNATPPAMPGILSLYGRDFTIKRSMTAFVSGLLIAGGIQWASQPVQGVPPSPYAASDAEMAGMITVGGLVLSGVGLAVLLWRYLRVRKILIQGTVIKGMMEDIEVGSWTTQNDSSSIKKSTTRYSYHAHLRYMVNGAEKMVRLKLPNSGFTYGLAKGRETDLSVLDSAPDKPLIRAVYLGRSA